MKTKGNNKSKDKAVSISHIKQLKETVFDLKLEDETLARFLKFNGHNVSKAEESLRKTMKWYKDNDVGSYLYWKPPQALIEDYRFSVIGRDHEGHAVIYMPIGDWHTKKMIESGYTVESLQYRFYILETIMDAVRQTEKSKFVMIMDMEGLTYKKCAHYETIQFLALAFKDFEEHYPERLRAGYVINAPWAFSYIYNALKHVFSSKTLSKAKIFDSDASKWKPFLAERIPPKYLSSFVNSNLCSKSET